MLATVGSRRYAQRPAICTASEAVAVLGGARKVAAWLRIPRAEVDRMVSIAEIDRGYFGHFFLTLSRRGYTTESTVFGLPTWGPLLMPTVAARRQSTSATT